MTWFIAVFVIAVLAIWLVIRLLPEPGDDRSIVDKLRGKRKNPK